MTSLHDSITFVIGQSIFERFVYIVVVFVVVMTISPYYLPQAQVAYVSLADQDK